MTPTYFQSGYAINKEAVQKGKIVKCRKNTGEEVFIHNLGEVLHQFREPFGRLTVHKSQGMSNHTVVRNANWVNVMTNHVNGWAAVGCCCATGVVVLRVR